MNAKQTGALVKALIPHITANTTCVTVVHALEDLLDSTDDGLLRRDTLANLIDWVENHALDDEDFLDMCNRLHHGPECFKGI